MSEKDIVEKAVSTAGDERTATGEVNDVGVKLEKEKYRTKVQKTLWKVRVTTERGDIEKRTSLSQREADELFEELVEEHELKEKE